MFTKLLARIIDDDDLHARWLNTLSYLEYVGARKIIKSQNEDDVDLGLLEHMAEEIHHAYFLKKLAHRYFSQSFSGKDSLLAKNAAKNYVQSVDAHCARFARTAHHAYLLTSYVIETRALVLYTVYDDHLQKRHAFRLTSILKQERRHLHEMEKALVCFDDQFISLKAALLLEESHYFHEWMLALQRELVTYDAITH